MTVNVLILRDRRPGHFHQSEGVVKALERICPVSVLRIDLARPRFLRGRALRGAIRALSATPSNALRLIHGIDINRLSKPDLIVSAGAETLSANAILARHFDTPNIFIGSLREMPETAFTAVLTVYPSQAVRPRHILTLKPPPFDPDGIPTARAISSAADLRGKRAALLVGGPSGSHDWSEKDWDRLVKLITTTADDLDMSWTITNSRRTPDAASGRFEKLAREHSGVSGFIDIRNEGSGSATALYGADILAVTEDSATMLMEAVATRRPVVGLVPETRRETKDDEAIDALERERRLSRLPLADISGERFADAVLTVEPLSENPLDLLAEKLSAVSGLINQNN